MRKLAVLNGIVVEPLRTLDATAMPHQRVVRARILVVADEDDATGAMSVVLQDDGEVVITESEIVAKARELESLVMAFLKQTQRVDGRLTVARVVDQIELADPQGAAVKG